MLFLFSRIQPMTLIAENPFGLYQSQALAQDVHLPETVEGNPSPKRHCYTHDVNNLEYCAVIQHSIDIFFIIPSTSFIVA